MSATTLAGWSLVVGSVAFGLGAVNPALWRAWMAPRDEFLRIVALRPGAWRLTSLLFFAATVLVAAGFAILPAVLADDSARALAAGGAVAFGIGGALWVLTLGHRLAVVPVTAAAFVATGTADPAAEPLDRLMGACFQAFIVLGAAGVAAVSLGLGVDGLIPALVAWGAAALSALLVVALVATGDVPPFTVFIAPLAFGIALVAR